MPDDISLLIMRARKGDTNAVEALLGQYEKRIYNISLRITGNEFDAYDAAQESLVKIFKSIASFRGESSFSSFLYRLTVNTCIDFLRKRRSDVSIESAMEDGVFFEDRSSVNPENAAMNNEINRTILNALQSLSEEHKVPIVLKDIQGFSYEEIARILNLSMGTVKSRLFRGREKLKNMLAGYLNH